MTQGVGGTRDSDGTAALREIVAQLRRDVQRIDDELRTTVISFAKSEVAMEHGDREVRQEVRVIEDALNRLAQAVSEATNSGKARHESMEARLLKIENKLAHIERSLDGDNKSPGIRDLVHTNSEFIKTFKARAFGVAIGAGIASGGSVVGLLQIIGV